jgi:hypothetical protein
LGSCEDPGLLAALIGFVGVIVGAVMTGGVSIWQQRQRDRLDVRTSARLLLERFQTARHQLEHNEENPFLGYLPTERFEAPEWDDVRRVFAAHLDDETFRVIARGVQQLERDRQRSLRLYDERLREMPPPEQHEVNHSLFVYRRTMIPLRQLAERDLRPRIAREWHRVRPPRSPGADADGAALLEEIAEMRARRNAERESRSAPTTDARSADDVSRA